jgi:hypothetical protein
VPSRKQEKRRRKLRVHGPSSDAVGAPPTGRKEPRPAATPVRTRSGREPAVPSLKRSLRKGGFMGIFMLGIVVVTTRGRGTGSMVIALLETIPLIFLFVAFDLWMARKVYKRVTGREAPRPEKTPRDEKRARRDEEEAEAEAEPDAEPGPDPDADPDAVA